jgi:hypothetical protein
MFNEKPSIGSRLRIMMNVDIKISVLHLYLRHIVLHCLLLRRVSHTVISLLSCMRKICVCSTRYQYSNRYVRLLHVHRALPVLVSRLPQGIPAKSDFSLCLQSTVYIDGLPAEPHVKNSVRQKRRQKKPTPI